MTNYLIQAVKDYIWKGQKGDFFLIMNYTDSSTFLFKRVRADPPGWGTGTAGAGQELTGDV